MTREEEELLAAKQEYAQAMVQAQEKNLPKASTIWHEQLIDWILINPDGSWKEAAEVFGVTKEYISMLTRSDAFKMKLMERRKEFDEVMHRKILNKMNRVADKSLDNLLDRLEHKADFLDEEFLLKAAGKMTEGIRPKADPAPVISPQVSVSVSIPVSADTLNEARKRIKTIEGQKLNLQIEDLSE